MAATDLRARPVWTGPLLSLRPLLDLLPPMDDARLRMVAASRYPVLLAPDWSMNWLAEAVAVRNADGTDHYLSKRTWARLAVEGVDPWTADRLAVALGLTPWQVWGQAWADAMDETLGQV